MTRSSRHVCVAVVLGALVMPAASAAAPVQRSSQTFTFSNEAFGDLCRDIVGLGSGTRTVSFQNVDTPSGQHLVVNSFDTTTVRVDYPDGTVLLASRTARLPIINAGAVSRFNDTLHFSGTLFDAAGSVIGVQRINLVSSMTFANGVFVE